MFESKKCSYCGKEFIPAPLHMYRAEGKYQCSYTCYRREGGDGGGDVKVDSVASVSEMRAKTKK